ncbi:MAG: hypothetical protein ACR2G2_05860 [Pseudonocardia sp.]
MTLVGLVLRSARALRLAARPRLPGAAGQRLQTGPRLPVGRDAEGLTRWQADHAEYRLAALRADDRRAVEAACETARLDVRPHLRRALAAGRPAAQALALAELLATSSPGWVAERLRLVDDGIGAQRRLGARIDQMDGTTCGTTVLVVLAAHADPLLALALTAPPGDEPGAGFGTRFDLRQDTVHRQSNRFWPGALGTSPWGMVGWLRRHAGGVGRYRVRLVDDTDPTDLAAVLAEVVAALDLGTPVPLLVGVRLPRHYVLALRRVGWRAGADRLVYEPSSGEVRLVPPVAVVEHRLAPLLGFDHLLGVLLPWD